MKGTDLTIEKLEELKKRTKDKFTKLLIDHLKKRLSSTMKKDEIYKKIAIERILDIVEKEENRRMLKRNKKLTIPSKIFNLKVIKLGSKKRELTINGDATLSKLSQLIQKEFDLEWGHLYEFKIGNYKFGPRCDEWQEIFDELDNFKLGCAIYIAKLNATDSFKFLYDFGDNIKFKIEITNIEDLSSKNDKR